MARTGKFDAWLNKDGLAKIEKWARDGLTDKQISHNIGIRPQTLYEWKKKSRELTDTLKKAKLVADVEVENALYKRALGYKTEEITEIYRDDVVVEKKITKKEVLPDTTAQIFWLKNRMPERWRDKRDIEMSKNIDDSIKEMETYFANKKSGS